MDQAKRQYTLKETQEKMRLKLEVLNSITHGVGIPLGIFFLVVLILTQVQRQSIPGIVAYAIYGGCFIWLFLCSTVYHAVQPPKVKAILRIFDHTAIYLFIAGSFTPAIFFLTQGLPRILFMALIWTIALAGTLFKIITYKNYDKWIRVTVFLYIAMGWLGLLFLKPIIQYGLWKFFFFIAFGGILYTVGTYFYRKTDWTWHHVVWHLFVLAAAVTQFIGFYLYLS